MASNVEIKARARSLSAIHDKALALGASDEGTLHQVDTFFACETGRLKLREFGDGTAELIAYHRSNSAELRESQYERTAIPDGASLRNGLDMVLGITGIVRKKRDLLLLGPTRIHLDTVEGLGEFVELEVVLGEGDSLESGHAIGAELMANLGITQEDCLADAYIDLLKMRGSEIA